MHSEYITTCCITNEWEKFQLLKYAEIDITKISKYIKPLTIDLMDQCCNYLQSLHNYNKQNNKKYYKWENNTNEKLKDLEFIKEKFIEYFSYPGPKSKEDLFVYLFAYNINSYYYSNYIYNILVSSVKKYFTDDFFKKYSLQKYKINNINFPDYGLPMTIRGERHINQKYVDLSKPISILEEETNKFNAMIYKLNIYRSFNIILDNFYCKEAPMFDTPYKDQLTKLIDCIKVYSDLEKPKQNIKRI